MPDGRHQKKHGREERRELPDRERTALRLHEREDDDEGHPDHRDQLEKRHPGRRHALLTQRERPNLFVHFAEAVVFVRVAVVDLDDALAVVGFEHRPDELPEGELLTARERLDAAVHPPNHDRKERRDDEAHEREHPVVPDEHGDEADDLNRVAHHRGEHPRRARQRVRGFIDELRLKLRIAVLHEGLVAPTEHARKKHRPDFEQDRLRDAHQKIGAQVAGAAVEDRNADQRQGSEVHRQRVLAVETHVGELPQDEGDERRSAAPGRHRGDGARDVPLEGRKVSGQPHHGGSPDVVDDLEHGSSAFLEASSYRH